MPSWLKRSPTGWPKLSPSAFTSAYVTSGATARARPSPIKISWPRNTGASGRRPAIRLVPIIRKKARAGGFSTSSELPGSGSRSPSQCGPAQASAVSISRIRNRGISRSARSTVIRCSTTLAVVFYVLFMLTLGPAIGEPFFAGFVVGYLFYDGTHYFVHHFVPTTRWGKFLRRHHMTRHHARHHGGFAVSTPLRCISFRSLPLI